MNDARRIQPRAFGSWGKRMLMAAVAWAHCVAFFGCAQRVAGPERVPLKCGDATVWAEIADDPAERERGLMMRRELPEDHGMIFVFESTGRQSFWMRNTLIPLSIAYLGERGEVLEMHDMFPLDRSAVGSQSESVRYALEVNRGWFSRNGVDVGETFDLTPLTSRRDK